MIQYQNIIVHYHEIALKKGNRPLFEKQLQRNISRATKKLGVAQVLRQRGRILLNLAPECQLEFILRSLEKVFGIAYFAPAISVKQDIAAISEAALACVENRTFASFRVATKRSQKAFPLNSVEVNRLIGARIQDKTHAAVDLKNSDLTVFIEIFENEAVVYSDRREGPGGLPVGTGDRAVSLLSSGIDSPVASFKMMKRGIRVIFVHFHSIPYTSIASQQNVQRLVEVLTTYQFKSRLYFVPFLQLQQHITSIVPASYRIIMYRRAMFRIAEAIARKHRANALITGENVAQVASQTLANIRAINEVVKLPVLRPLAGDDKREIIAKARQIGTYDISIQPYEDCCSLFVPGNPETRAKLDLVHKFDAKIDYEKYITKALENTELKEIAVEIKGILDS